jgi:hypothetical protein
MLPQLAPLHGKCKLLGLHPLDFAGEILTDSIHCGGRAIADIGGPLPPGLPIADRTQRFKQRVIGEPMS